jgi:hypothetical protein
MVVVAKVAHVFTMDTHRHRYITAQAVGDRPFA